MRRRDFLHAGALGFLGMSLPDLFALEASGAANTDKEKNCIFLMMEGVGFRELRHEAEAGSGKPDTPAIDTLGGP